MENEEMSKADLIAMLVSIREVARANGELKRGRTPKYPATAPCVITYRKRKDLNAWR